MDLKTRRNLPLVILFIMIVATLVFGLGSQPIVAYTFEGSRIANQADNDEVGQSPVEVDPLSTLSATADTADDTQIGFAAADQGEEQATGQDASIDISLDSTDSMTGAVLPES